MIIVFSWAGEKMPWLTMHLTIPLAFITGYFLNGLLRTDWRMLYRRGALWFALLLSALLVIAALQFFYGPVTLTGVPLDQANKIVSFISALLAMGLIVGVLIWLSTKIGSIDSARIALLTVALMLAALTIRATIYAAYVNSDSAVETMIYAQGSPDVPLAISEIEDLSRKLCAQTSADSKPVIPCDNGMIKVAYDDESAWPFVWYLRRYRNVQYFGKSPSAPVDAVVVIVGRDNENAVKSFLGDRYARREYRRIWWPLEGYKNLTLERLLFYLQPDNFKALVHDVWFFRQYKESLNQWPLVDNFIFYVRKDVSQGPMAVWSARIQ